jgi:hypothetical protein
MSLVVFIFLAILPVSAVAQNVGDLSPNPLSSNSTGNPFTSGGPWSAVAPRNQDGGRASPTSPYTWSNVSPVSPSSLPRSLESGGPLRNMGPVDQGQAGPRVGPYGITLPPGHPLSAR